MSADQSRTGNAYQARPDVYDPMANPELFRGVLSARAMAFIIDVIVMALPIIAATIFISIFGLLTLGLGWLLFWPLNGVAIIWPVLYYGFTLGGRHSATPGMRMMGVEMRSTNGAPGNFVLGAAHAVIYWVSVSVLTPFIVLVGLFNSRSRLLHDFILGTVVVNSAARAASLGGSRR
jgi:uncharacterized RDD family membrane protein YckC